MKKHIAAILTLCVSFLLFAQQHPTGFLQPSPEEAARCRAAFHEYPSTQISATPQMRGGALPSSHANIEHLPLVGHQGNMSICGSFQPAYYLGNYYLSLRNGDGRYNPATDAGKMVSPMWAVYMFQHGDDGSHVQPVGGNTEDCVRGLCEIGYLTWEEMPFDGAHGVYYLPTAETQLKALKRRFGGYGVILSDITTPEGLEKLKTALANGDIFVVATAPIPLNFDQYPIENPVLDKAADDTTCCNNNGVFVWADSGECRDFHALTIVGYDDNKRYINKEGEESFGALLAVNSWGTDWGVQYNGEGGYVWIAYDAFQKYGFLGGKCWSLCMGQGGYEPTLMAKVTVKGNDGDPEPWYDPMLDRPWLHNLDFTLNGHGLENQIPANYYLVGRSYEDWETGEILVDLSGFDDIDFAQFGIGLSFAGAQDSFGKILSVEVFNGDGELLWQKEMANAELKPYSNSYPRCQYYAGVFEETEGALPEIYPHTGAFAMGDLNGDGRLDAVASVKQAQAGNHVGFEYFTCVFLQNAQGGWTRKNLSLPLNGRLPDVLLVDLDGDGVLDIAATDGEQAVFLKNDGMGNFTTLSTLALDDQWQGIPGFFATADFDNDGKPDFVLMTSKGTYVLRQKTSTEYTPYLIGKRVLRPSDADSNAFGRSLAVGDVNGDGWTDIVAMGQGRDEWGNTYILYVNQGDMTFVSYKLDFNGTDYCTIAMGDADQDGCDDILVSGTYSHYVYSDKIGGYRDQDDQKLAIFKGRPDVGGVFQPPMAAPIDIMTDAVIGGNAAWVDLDNDGRMEAVVAGTTLGATSSGGDPYGEDSAYPLSALGRNYMKILRWDGTKFTDAGVELPGTVGFSGPSMLAVVDMDGDGLPDIVHGGCFGCKSRVNRVGGPNRSICGMKLLRNILGVTVNAPSAPTTLTATSLGNGRARLSWNAPAGQRFILRVGTASGKCDVLSPENGAFYKPGVVLNHLPARTLYWAVQTVDAMGNVSAWSAEGSFSSSGSAVAPSPAEDCPDETTEVPEYTITCVSEDESRGSARAAATCKSGRSIGLVATPKEGWTFSCWTGDAPIKNCLSQNATAVIHGDAHFTAHFVPAGVALQTDDKHLGLLQNGCLWFYENPFEEVPAFAAATGCTFFTLADGTAYFDRIGPRSWDNRLLRAVNGNLWFLGGSVNFGDAEGMGGYLEQTKSVWGGPGGLAVRFQFETAGNNGHIEQRLDVVHAKYGFYPPRQALRDGEEYARCVLQKNFLMMLTTEGRVRFIGINDGGQFGAAAPYRLHECTEISSLPDVFFITAGTSFAAAIDCEGALWTWGDNRKGQLGRGVAGGYLPTPAKVTGLPAKVVAISAGDDHLAVLCEDGSLHLYGDNAFGQLGAENGRPLADKRVIAVSAAGKRTAAVDADGVIYLWGDGFMAPVEIDNTSFETVRCQVTADDRAVSQLSVGVGGTVARAGVPISIHADSTDKAIFQHWLVDGVQHDENPLVVTLTQDSVIQAVFQLMRPLVSFGEPQIDGNTITVDVQLSQADQQYEGFQFTLNHPADMAVQDLQHVAAWWLIIPLDVSRFDTENPDDGTVTTEFYFFHDYSAVFKVDEPLRLIFTRPTNSPEAFVEWVGTPQLSRNLGAISEEADTDDGFRIALDNRSDDGDFDVNSCEVKIPAKGHYGVLSVPGLSGVRTLAELEDALGVSGLRLWTWNGTRMEELETLAPNQPAIFTVESKNSDTASLYYQPVEAPDVALKPGWNLIMLPEEAPLPQEATAGFSLDEVNRIFVQHAGLLQPGKPYWIFVKE